MPFPPLLQAVFLSSSDFQPWLGSSLWPARAGLPWPGRACPWARRCWKSSFLELKALPQVWQLQGELARGLAREGVVGWQRGCGWQAGDGVPGVELTEVLRGAEVLENDEFDEFDEEVGKRVFWAFC